MNEKKTQKTYHFNTFPGAKLVAKRAVEMGVENVQIKPWTHGFSVSFVSSWEVELNVISLNVPCTKEYRTGRKWNPEEYDFVVDAYMCWHSIDEIANKIQRCSSSVVAALARQGYFERADSLQDAWDDAWHEPNCDDFLFDTKGLLNRFYLLDVGIMSEERAYGVDFTQEEINEIFKFLMWFDRWGCAARFSLELGDVPRAFRLARQGENMLLALKMLNSAPNLSQMYSAQRDMLNAFFRKKIIDELPLEIERWVASAKVHPRARGVKRPIYPIEIVLKGSRKHFPDDLLALIGNSAELEELVRKGNRLAACLLAGIFRSDLPLNSADAAARKVQDGYWPTKDEIEILLRNHLPFDEKIAHKLSHVLTSVRHNWAKEKRSYYKYHLLMSHEYHHPKWGTVQEESDDEYSEYSGQPVCLHCGHPVDKLWGVCSDCAAGSKGGSIGRWIGEDVDIDD